MDLIKAEAMADLIQADHELLAETAAEQMSGSLTDIIRGMSDKLLGWTALLEAAADYPDEALEETEDHSWRAEFAAICAEMEDLISTMPRGKLIRQGLRVVLAGKPNVGKSSVMNALLGDERAIVTDIPGTTRDTLEEGLLVKGVPIVLTDTAGLCESADRVERIGVERGRRAMERADVILYVLEVNGKFDSEISREIEALDANRTWVLVNKADLTPTFQWEQMFRSSAFLRERRPLWISARDRTGLDVLAQRLRERFLSGTQDEKMSPCLINARHGAALTKAKDALRHAMTALDEGFPMDMISIDLRQAWMYLGEITGTVSDEALIDRIFSEFCLGK
jgi:tRNA modification GTPase